MHALFLVLLMAVTQSHYRFGIDELAESTHGWHANEDANPATGAMPLDTTFLLRFTLQCDGTAQANVDAEFQYRRNGGAWIQITTTTTVVKAVTPSAWANAAHTTHRLSGTGTFESSSQGCTADGIAGGAQMDIVASGNAETECALQLLGADLVGGDLIEFRLTRDGGVLLDTYAVTPALTLELDPLSAGAQTVTVTAPPATAVATSTIQAGSNTVTVTAPTTTLVTGGEGQTVPAGAQAVTVTAPTATIVPIRLAVAGAQVITVMAPTATAVATSTIQAGSNTVTVTAPTATLVTGGEGQTVPAGAQAVTVTAPTATIVPIRLAVAGAQVVTVIAPDAMLVIPSTARHFLLLALTSEMSDGVLQAGDQVVTVTAPSAQLVPGGVVRAAGAQSVTFTAPTATISGATIVVGRQELVGTLVRQQALTGMFGAVPLVVGTNVRARTIIGTVAD